MRYVSAPAFFIYTDAEDWGEALEKIQEIARKMQEELVAKGFLVRLIEPSYVEEFDVNEIEDDSGESWRN